ncbi:hypothetical protein ADL22_12490 [Streptomyces sp. NRRL F-4489]|uniref:GntR family transcriptional regulator n=1 Tax=Streptomyces sp. NRRL F-4489 TaxID=1609095 RepID=UPI0007478820|nr:GntR family transcriptional regulator [Streptomyces sp. NRRL F-4489]KUL44754.1 hypothetical protein ADL22_12490 [Streptomyces sp. NRRL F-4489]
MSPEITRPLPPYMQVVTHLREQIITGALADGDVVPSERQLERDWGISRSTATKVLGVLRAEGLVTSRQGVGTIVTTKTLHHSAYDRTRAVEITGRIYPKGQYAKILSARIEPASERAAQALGIEPGQEAIRRQRVTYAESGAAVSASTSWFDLELAEIVPQLLSTERIPGGTAKAIEDATGRSWTDADELLQARIASDEDADLLGITERPSAIIVGYNRLVDESGRTLEYGEYLCHGDRITRYSYARPRD